MATLPAAVTDDLIEDFFLRLPPEDPVSLLHAALVCKRWCRILADRGFRRRFCEHHHRRPPLLGYFRYDYDGPAAETKCPLFTPTSSFRPRDAGHSFSDMKAIDSRHGRVLISRDSFLPPDPWDCRLSVWDPITGDLLTLPSLSQGKPLPCSAHNFTWNAVVLCATSGLISATTGLCDCHCNRRPFLVVFIGTSIEEVYALVYSSEAGVWRHTTSVARDTLSITYLYHPHDRASVVAGDAVFFQLFTNNVRILKYDLGAQEISSVDLPDRCRGPRILLLTTTEYGGLLGVASVDKTRIDLWWSREAGPDGRFRWEPPRVIELQQVPYANPCFRWEPLLPRQIEPQSLIYVVDIVHSLGVVIVKARHGVFSVDIESRKATKLGDDNYISWFVPYLSFCTPALGAAFTGDGPSGVVSKCKNERRRTEISIGRIIKCLLGIVGLLWGTYFVVHRFAGGFLVGRHLP